MRPNFIVLLIGILCAATGCKRVDDDLMPMRVGKSWRYSVKSGFNSYVLPTKVAREISVANTKGFELDGALGTSRLAWTEKGLVAEKLNNSQFIPPLPLLTNDGSATKWSGVVINIDRTTQSTATTSQKADEEIELGVEKVRAVKSTVNLQLGKNQVELLTWFQPGKGIVMQEQRTNGTLLVRLSIVEN